MNYARRGAGYGEEGTGAAAQGLSGAAAQWDMFKVEGLKFKVGPF